MNGKNGNEKNFGIELLQDNDLTAQGYYGPLVGWLPSKWGLGIVNPRGWAALRVKLWKVVEEAGEKVKAYLYDQKVIVENAGAIVVLLDEQGRVGMVQQHRMIGERLFHAGKDYVRRLEEEGRWDELLASLGQMTYECPKGLADVDGTDPTDFVVSVAKAEALEEAGCTIGEAKVLSARVNANTTFFPHSQYVVVGKVVNIGDAKHEDLEIIGSTKFFTPSEIREMVDNGHIVDGLTLSALALAGIHF